MTRLHTDGGSSRPLTEVEQQFVREAEKHYFVVLYHASGYPYAMGARGTGGVFSMDVREVDDFHNHGSLYLLADALTDEKDVAP